MSLLSSFAWSPILPANSSSFKLQVACIQSNGEGEDSKSFAHTGCLETTLDISRYFY